VDVVDEPYAGQRVPIVGVPESGSRVHVIGRRVPHAGTLANVPPAR
jgi:hypothetical protein